MELEIREDNRLKVTQEVQKEIKKALEAIGTAAESHAIENAYAQHAANNNNGGSTWHGRMAGSVTHSVDEKEQCVYIGVPTGKDMKYAIYFEFGTGIYYAGGGRRTPWSYKDAEGNWHRTHGQVPKPFLRPAISDNMREYQDTFKQILGELNN